MILEQLKSQMRNLLGPTPHTLHQDEFQMDWKFNESRKVLERNIGKFLYNFKVY